MSSGVIGGLILGFFLGILFMIVIACILVGSDPDE